MIRCGTQNKLRRQFVAEKIVLRVPDSMHKL